MAGIDIYDCVVVINDRKALEAFSKVRVSLGGEISVVAGPVGAGGIVESEVMKNRKPLWSYMKSRGLYGGVQLDGTIIVERNDENARFYGERLPISQILAGNVKIVPSEIRMLMEVVKQAEGRTDVDPVILDQAGQQPPPSDFPVEKVNEPTQAQVSFYTFLCRFRLPWPLLCHGAKLTLFRCINLRHQRTSRVKCHTFLLHPILRVTTNPTSLKTRLHHILLDQHLKANHNIPHLHHMRAKRHTTHLLLARLQDMRRRQVVIKLSALGPLPHTIRRKVTVRGILRWRLDARMIPYEL
jgi:Las17-binding protein actin regulator